MNSQSMTDQPIAQADQCLNGYWSSFVRDVQFIQTDPCPEYVWSDERRGYVEMGKTIPTSLFLVIVEVTAQGITRAAVGRVALKGHTVAAYDKAIGDATEQGLKHALNGVVKSVMQRRQPNKAVPPHRSDGGAIKPNAVTPTARNNHHSS